VIDLPPGGLVEGTSAEQLLRSSRPDPRRRPRAVDGRQIVCEGLVRIYKVADLEVVALQGLDLVVGVGEMIAIVGASGSGKSTLLNILGGLDTPSAGRAGGRRP
jgi:ABC-type glutathione transport system ATPase component